MTAASDVTARPVRPFLWSVRRELWEHRSIVVAPLAAFCLMLAGSLASTGYMPTQMQAMAGLDPARQAAELLKPYHFAAFIMTMVMLIVGMLYCLDALHGERRDRSLLFWKSLPVSDTTTVLAKAAIPLLVLPVVTVVLTLALQAIMLQLGTVTLLLLGVSTAILWTGLPLLQLALSLIYGLGALTLWFAPIYGWLLLVSGWARGKVFLWAILPPLGACILEKIVFHTAHGFGLLKYRLIGVMTDAFAMQPQAVLGDDSPMQPDPVKFLASHGLWIGLAVAAGFLTAAIWLRRKREPM
jgi:ABC-2 type transport system permease protein